MPRLTVEAPAKLNLTLDVLGKRPDGYHDLRMVMQSITLGDTLTLEPGGEGVRGCDSMFITSPGPLCFTEKVL